MKRNEGTTDRVLRAAAGVLLAAVSWSVGIGTVGGVALLAVSAVLLGTAAVGFCPLYRVLGVDTCPVRRRPVGTPAGHVGR